jgi:hypothetical protein
MKEKPKKYSTVFSVKNTTRLESSSLIEKKEFLQVKRVNVPFIDVEKKHGGGLCNYVFDIVDNYPVFD